MANLPSVKKKISVEASRYRSAVSEFVAQTLGKSVNWLIDQVEAMLSALDSFSASEVSAITVTNGYVVPAGYTLFAVGYSAGAGAGGGGVTVLGVNQSNSNLNSGSAGAMGAMCIVKVYGAGATVDSSSSSTGGDPVVYGLLIRTKTIDL